jgi:hypothetical protein
MLTSGGDRVVVEIGVWISRDNKSQSKNEGVENLKIVWAEIRLCTHLWLSCM